jgi:hypothetical protein
VFEGEGSSTVVLIESKGSESSVTGAPPEAPVFLAAGAPGRGEYRCAACGYGVMIRTVLPQCPMCRGRIWDEAGTSPFGRAAS